MIDMLASTITDTTHLPWAELFLAQIRAGETVEQASAAAGVTRSWAYTCRAENEAFHAAWEAAVAEARQRLDWRPVFLASLREGRTIVDACARGRHTPHGIPHAAAGRGVCQGVGRASARGATGLTHGGWASGVLMAYSLLTMATQWRYAMSDHGSVARSGPRLRRRLPRPIDWRARFIAALRDGERVERACAAATITPSFAYQQRCADPAFRRAWDQARADAPRPEWQRTFLHVLAEQQSVRHAIAAAGRAPSYVYRVRAEDSEFRARWDEALAGERRRPEWQAVFLSTLAETKHITRARLAAGVASSLVYRVRAKDPEFRARWEQAINGPLPPDNDPQTPP